MHRFFVLLLPLLIISAKVAPKAVPKPANPQVALTTLVQRLTIAQSGKDRDKIAQACDAILLAHPTHYQAQMVLADLHFARHEYRKSAGDYARVLLLHPDDANALSGAAWSALHLGDLERAEHDLAQLLSIKPDYPNAKLGHDIATGKQALSPMGLPHLTSSRLAESY